MLVHGEGIEKKEEDFAAEVAAQMDRETLIAHFNDEDAEKYKKEYEEMIDRNLRKIIEIIKEYK